MQHSTTHHSTTQHTTAQHSRTQHNTAAAAGHKQHDITGNSTDVSHQGCALGRWVVDYRHRPVIRLCSAGVLVLSGLATWFGTIAV